jgi:hypothetical protein
VRDTSLRRYWIEFEPTPSGLITPWTWFGVTAIDVADAVELIRRFVQSHRSEPIGPLPPVARVIEDVDVSTLDAGHVLPNMDPPLWRGVWYPRSGMTS